MSKRGAEIKLVVVSREQFMVSGLDISQEMSHIVIVIREADCLEAIPQTVVLQYLSDSLSYIKKNDYIAFIASSLLQKFSEALTAISQELSRCGETSIILAERKAPPAEVRRFDGTTSSFVCPSEVWRALLAEPLPTEQSLCYLFLSQVMAGTLRVKQLLVRQLPLTSMSTSCDPMPRSVAVIMPHRHTVEHLATSMFYMRQALCARKAAMYVGLDIEDISPYVHFALLAQTRLYCIDAAKPLGPYVFRQALIDEATEELLLYQDTDDLSCSDRVEVLERELQIKSVDMVGSHELQVDEIEKKVFLFRFPLDVSSVVERQDVSGVSDNAAEPVLHATTMLKRTSFQQAGGLSTNRRIANDSQFFLRASLALKICNVDAFLYVRRVHHRALTSAPETHNGNSVRKELSALWAKDFKRIKRGELALSESSLIAVRGGPTVALKRVAPDDEKVEGLRT